MSHADRKHLRVIKGEKDIKPVDGRVPPHDLDAEAAVLSAVLLERDALDRVLEILKPEHFYSEPNRRIYEAAVDLALEGSPIDVVSVASWLRSREWLVQVGGAGYLAQIVDATPAVAHVAAHAKIVFEKWRIRELIAKCWRILSEGYGDVGKPQEFIENAIASLEELNSINVTGAQVGTIAQAIDEAHAMLEQVEDREGEVLGYSTGLRGFDACMGGLVPSELTLLGAKMTMPDKRIETSSAGKTAFAVTVVMHVAQNPYRTIKIIDDQRIATDTQIGVLYFSLEMPRKQMAMRMACHVAQVNWAMLRAGRFKDPATGRLRADVAIALREGMRIVRRLPIRIVTDNPMRPSGVRAKVLAARAAFAAEGVKLGVVVIDSIKWMRPNRETREPRPEVELNEIGRDLRDLSRDERIDGVHYIVVTQLQENGKPKDCTSLQDHASNVAVVDTQNVAGADEFEGTVHMKKIRDGERDERVPIRFLKRYGIFVDG